MSLFCVRSEQADSGEPRPPTPRPLRHPEELRMRANGRKTLQKALGGSLRDFGIYSVSSLQNPLVALRDVNTLTGPSQAPPASTPRRSSGRG